MSKQVIKGVLIMAQKNLIGSVAASQTWPVIKNCIDAARGTNPIVAIPLLVPLLSSSQVIILAVGATGIA